MNQDSAGTDTGRDESAAERDDRRYDELLQELRVIQTSAQLTAGFLLTLPFQQRFSELSTGQHRFYLTLVVLAALVMAVVLSPVAIHRQLSGRKVKGRLVEAAHKLAQLALGLLALLAISTVVFIFDVVVELNAAVTVGAALLVVMGGLLVVLPRFLARLDAHQILTDGPGAALLGAAFPVLDAVVVGIEAVPHAPEHCLGPAGRIDLAVQVANVGLDGVRAEMGQPRDLRVALPLGDQREDLRLPVRQPLGTSGPVET